MMAGLFGSRGTGSIAVARPSAPSTTSVPLDAPFWGVTTTWNGVPCGMPDVAITTGTTSSALAGTTMSGLPYEPPGAGGVITPATESIRTVGAAGRLSAPG